MCITNPIAEQETGNSFQKPPNNALLIQIFIIIQYYSNYFFIILIKTKHKNAIWVQIHSSNLVMHHFHQRGLGILARTSVLNQAAPKGLHPLQGLLPQRRCPDSM
jgi:hypothetical protein